MAYDLAKMTNNGNVLLAKIISDKSSLSIDKIEVSDTQLSSSTDITTMTSINNVVQTIQANGFDSTDSTLVISSVLDNTDVKNDYKAWVFGIWGSDSTNGTSQLIAVATSTNLPDTIPTFSGSTPVSYMYKFNIGFSDADKVIFNTSNDGYSLNSSVVHLVGNETIDGLKTFNQDPVDKDGNDYGLAKDIDTKVTDNRDGTITVNSQTYVPADDSKVVHRSGDEEVTGIKTFDTAPVNKSDGKLYITATAQQPQDSKETADAQDGSTAWVRLPKGTEGLPDANNGYMVRTINDGADLVQLAVTEAIPDTIYQRTYPSGQHWTNWHAVGSVPDDVAKLDQDANFTGKLQKNGKDVATLDKVGSMIKPSSANTQDSALSDSKNDTSSYFTWE